MQSVIHRYFWLFGASTAVLAAWFTAKGVNHVIEGKYLSDPARAPKIPRVYTETPTIVAQVHNKDGAGLVTRNVFCSECTPAPAATPNSDPSQIATTSLPLVLVATNVSDDTRYSFATIFQNNENAKQGSYYIGDSVPGGGAVKEIHFKHIDFENNGRIERMYLLGATPPPAVSTPAPVETPTVAANPSKDEMQSAIDNGIRKTGDNQYEIDKSLVDKVLANPMAVVKGARVVPAIVDGKVTGFKLYAIRPDSVYSKLGLSNGDTINSINGFELTSAEKGLEVYTKLREATSLQMEVTRRGKPVELKYAVK